MKILKFHHLLLVFCLTYCVCLLLLCWFPGRDRGEEHIPVTETRVKGSRSDDRKGLSPKQQFAAVESSSLPYLANNHTTHNYMLRQASRLRREARQLSSPMPKVRQSNTTRHGFPLHFVTYATPNMNLTAARIVRQAQRSGLFETCTLLGPEHIFDEFRQHHGNLLHDPSCFAWRYPMWDWIQQTLPLYEYVLYLDAGCTIRSSGLTMLQTWLEQLEEASASVNNAKELMRFPQNATKGHKEIRWTTDAVFQAFGLEADDWPGALQQQFYGGLLLTRNGGQWRTMLALIYETLAPNPDIITDADNAATKRRRPGRFEDFRHDQSISSIASKLLQNYIMPSEHNLAKWGAAAPFGISRFRSVSEQQLEKWTSACAKAGREKDVFCDDLAETLFDLNSEIPS